MFKVTVKPPIPGLSGKAKWHDIGGTVLGGRYSNKNGGKNGGMVFGGSVLEDFTVSW